MRTRFIIILLLFSSFFSALCTSAAEIMLRRLTIPGFSNNLITALYQDRNGLMWIGSSTGLYYFDGFSLRQARMSESEDINSVGGYIDEIFEDSLGRLWVKSDGSYALFDPFQQTATIDLSGFLSGFGLEGYLSAAGSDDRGNIWIAPEGKGLYKLDFTGQRSFKVAGSEGVKFSDITFFGDRLYAVTSDGTLFIINPSDLIIESKSKDSLLSGKHSDKVYSLFADRSGNIWMYSNERLHLFDSKSQSWSTGSLPAQGRDGVVKRLFQTTSGNLYIARDNHGIERVERDGIYFKFVKEDITGDFNPDNTVTAILEDKSGTLWVGTYKRGLFSYNATTDKFTLESFPDVNCMIAGQDGIVWVGTDSSGLWRWNVEKGEKARIRETEVENSTPAITALALSGKGELYIGSYSNGLRILKGGKLGKIVTGSTLDNNYVWSLSFDRDDNLWVGTLGGGVYRVDALTKGIKSYNHRNSGLDSDYVLSSMVSRDGRIYFGTSTGISVYNPIDDRITSYRLGKEGKGDKVYKVTQIYEDSRDLIWVATNVGLKVIDRKKNQIQDISLNLESRSPFILGLIEDNSGGIWVSEGPRLHNIKVSQTPDADAISTFVHTYDSRDGLQKSDFNQRSFLKFNNGDMAVGGMYGVNRFSPSTMRLNNHLPKVIFTDLRVGRQFLNVGEKINGRVALEKSLLSADGVKFSHDLKEFTIFFASDNYALPEKTKFLYKLDGYSDEWLECAEGVNHVTYTNLSPGNYRLMVKAVNGDGYESEQAAVLPIKVYPSFWGSSWGIALYILIGVGIVFLIVRMVIRRERRHFEQRRREDAIRKQEELNQMKFKFFTNVSHDLRTPLTLIVTPLEEMLKESKDERQTRRLTLMRKNAMRLLTLVNQLLDFRKNEVAGLKLKPSEGDIVSFARNVCNSFMSLSDRKNIKLTFYSPVESIYTGFDEDKMEKIFMNLLGNAFKFTPADGRIDVSVEYADEQRNRLRITIADTGIGIKDKDKEHIFERFYQVNDQGESHPEMGSGIGLSMVSEYVKLHNGIIKVADNVVRGSVFIIEMPIMHEDTCSSVSSMEEAVKTEETAQGVVSTPSKSAGRKIALVIDDNPDMTEMLKEGLETDFDVITTHDGEEALKIVENVRPSIILTDLMMPGMNGMELCRRLKGDPLTVSIPIIIVTAKHDLDVKLEGLTIGADDYITKPFNLDVLRLRMKRLVALTDKGAKRSLIEPEPEAVEITPLDEQFIAKAMKYVSDNISRPELSVEELSSKLGMSRVRLYKKLKQITGKTPIEFIRIIRLKRAAQLLRESQMNVSEIAYQTGFNNPKVFSKYFKDEFGLLPSAYQNKEGKETNYTV